MMSDLGVLDWQTVMALVIPPAVCLLCAIAHETGIRRGREEQRHEDEARLERVKARYNR